jgi:hypothetical protein
MAIKKLQMIIKYIGIYHSKICPNFYFWFEKEPSGNPVPEMSNGKTAPKEESFETDEQKKQM